MRSPNQAEIKAQCLAAIEPLMRKHGLEGPVKVTADTHGWVNPCFFVNEKYVVRFNARDRHLPKFQREKTAFELLRSRGIPVPQNVRLDESKDVVPFDVLISDKLPGLNLESNWEILDVAMREDLAQQAGGILRDVHRTGLPYFGEISGHGPLPRTQTWWEYLKAKFEMHLSEAAELHLFDENALVEFCEAFSDTKPALKEVTAAALVHGDGHLGNFLFADGRISGVLDFEWAFAGDPLYDFCHWTRATEIWPNSRDPFLRGAGKPDFSEAELRRLNLYHLIGYLEVSSVAAKYFPAEEAREYVAKTLEYLRRIRA